MNLVHWVKERKFLYGFLAIIAGTLLLTGIFFRKEEAPPSGTAPLATYHNPALKVSFDYPSSWQPDTQFPLVGGIPTKLGGLEGFFAVDMIGGAENLSSKELANNLIKHELKPYGENPQVVSTTVQDQEGTFLFRTENTGPANRNDAVLIVRYPKSNVFNNATYEFVMIFGTKSYIELLPRSLRFLD